MWAHRRSRTAIGATLATAACLACAPAAHAVDVPSPATVTVRPERPRVDRGLRIAIRPATPLPAGTHLVATLMSHARGRCRSFATKGNRGGLAGPAARLRLFPGPSGWCPGRAVVIVSADRLSPVYRSVILAVARVRIVR